MRLPGVIPLWLDVRRLLYLGWVTVMTPGYMATAKVHYRRTHWGIGGSRVHELYIWRDTGQTEMTTATADYRWQRGGVYDRLDDDGCHFINLILEYFA